MTGERVITKCISCPRRVSLPKLHPSLKFGDNYCCDRCAAEAVHGGDYSAVIRQWRGSRSWKRADDRRTNVSSQAEAPREVSMRPRSIARQRRATRRRSTETRSAISPFDP